MRGIASIASERKRVLARPSANRTIDRSRVTFADFPSQVLRRGEGFSISSRNYCLQIRFSYTRRIVSLYRLMSQIEEERHHSARNFEQSSRHVRASLLQCLAQHRGEEWFVRARYAARSTRTRGKVARIRYIEERKARSGLSQRSGSRRYPIVRVCKI